MQHKIIVILLSIVVITPQARGMEPLLKRLKSAFGYPSVSIQDLPHDLKGYLLPFIVSKYNGFSDGIFTVKDHFVPDHENFIIAATINKSFHNAVNDPGHMLTALKWILHNARYTAHAVDLAEQLQKKKATLPVLHDRKIIAWLAQTKNMLQDGEKLYKSVQNEREAYFFECLANRHIDLNYRSQDGSTALMICGYVGTKEIIKNLIAAGPSLDLQDNMGATALLCAADGGNSQLLTALIFAGANPDIKNRRGETPTDIALKFDHWFIAQMLVHASEMKKEKQQKKKASNGYCVIS